MTIEKITSDDFERAINKAFWRKAIAWLTGRHNELLPFDEVRKHLPMRGQRYRGYQQVPIQAIIGSLGRYRDFDRAFLPTQSRTKGRWVSIDRAHHEQAFLPPVELIKMGDIYFVKDGNHRVSVAREWGQEFIDAYVTEIDIPVTLTSDTQVDDLVIKQAYAQFMEQSGFAESKPDAEFETRVPEHYEQLLEHIKFHQWILGEKRKTQVSLSDAAISWYENIYLPLVMAIREQALLKEFRNSTEVALYLWMVKYQWYLRIAFRDENVPEDAEAVKNAKIEAARQVLEDTADPIVRKLIQVLQKADWIDELVLLQERADFLVETQIKQVRSDSNVEASLPGSYGKLLDQIAVHRWYLGEQHQQEVPYLEAVASWYDHVYMPLINAIREQNILAQFPDRTETDLFLWIVEEQAILHDIYGEEIPVDAAARQFADQGKKARKASKESKSSATD